MFKMFLCIPYCPYPCNWKNCANVKLGVIKQFSILKNFTSSLLLMIWSHMANLNVLLDYIFDWIYTLVHDLLVFHCHISYHLNDKGIFIMIFLGKFLTIHLMNFALVIKILFIFLATNISLMINYFKYIYSKMWQTFIWKVVDYVITNMFIFKRTNINYRYKTSSLDWTCLKRRLICNTFKPKYGFLWMLMQSLVACIQNHFLFLTNNNLILNSNFFLVYH
jgi:hypothetical protein